MSSSRRRGHGQLAPHLALGFHDEDERDAVLEAVPKAAVVPSVLIGRDAFEPRALPTLVEHATSPSWQWDAFIDDVRKEVEGGL